MVDPVNFTDYNRNDFELEECLLFSIMAAGKNAKTTARLLDSFLKKHGTSSPFKICEAFDIPTLTTLLKAAGFGCYTLKAQSIHQLVRSGLNLRTCTIDDLIDIRGIGRKTANLFLMHTRQNYKAACLDTHLLKFLRENGYDAPKSTPQSKKRYAELEKAFLSIAEKRKIDPTDLDLIVWRQYSKSA